MPQETLEPTAQQTGSPRNGASMSADANGPQAVETTGRKRRILIPLGVVVGIVLLIVGINYLIFASRHVSTDDAQVAGDITTVAPRVKGQVTAVYVSENQYVHRG